MLAKTLSRTCNLVAPEVLFNEFLLQNIIVFQPGIYEDLRPRYAEWKKMACEVEEDGSYFYHLPERYKVRSALP